MLKVRFWRDVVEELLQTRATDPRKVGALLRAHQEARALCDREKRTEQVAVAVAV
jgi:hypothetical protein